MREVVFWDNKLVESLLCSENLETEISDLLDTFECAQKDHAAISCCIDIYDQTSEGTCLGDWLFNKQLDPQLADLKRELSIRLSKSTQIESDAYDDLLEIVNQEALCEELVLCLKISKDSILFVCTPNRYWSAKQWFLSKYINKDHFVNEAISCFPNLFFHDNVFSSFNTINSDFNTVRSIIVEHLTALNNYHYDSSRWSEPGVDFRQIANEIQALYKIECSPQASRAAVRNLYFEFQNTKTKKNETLCCELHTKLKWHNMDRQNQDRIYFHPGKENIQDGRVLIAYIGTHI